MRESRQRQPHEPWINSERFTWIGADREFVADASDLPVLPPGGGFAIVLRPAPGTTRRRVVYLRQSGEEHDADGDLLYTDYEPWLGGANDGEPAGRATDGTSIRGFRVRVFND